MAHRPPQNFSETLFFEEIANSLNKMSNKYDNILLTRDLNIHLLHENKDTKNNLSDLCRTGIRKKHASNLTSGLLIDQKVFTLLAW